MHSEQVRGLSREVGGGTHGSRSRRLPSVQKRAGTSSERIGGGRAPQPFFKEVPKRLVERKNGREGEGRTS